MAVKRDSYYFTFMAEAELNNTDIPARSMTIRWYVDSNNKHSVSISAVFSDGAQEIISKASYFAIKYGDNYVIGDGDSYSDSIEISDVRYDEGAENISITVRGSKAYNPPGEPSSYDTPAKLTYRNMNNGSLQLRFSAIDWAVQLEDTIDIDGDSIVVEKIYISADATQENMQLTGYSEEEEEEE